MADTPDRPAPLHPRGMFGLLQEQWFGPPEAPPEPDPAKVAAEARQQRRIELSATLDLVQQSAVLVGLVVLEVLGALLLLGLIRAVW